MSTLPQIFDTSGMDAATLHQAAYLLQGNLQQGTPTEVTGPYAQQLVSLAGGQMDAQGLVTSNPSGFQFLKNVESADPTGIVKAAADTVQGSGPPTGTSVASWLTSHAANWSFMVVGAILVLGALLISQRETITHAVTTTAKTAAMLT